VDLAPVADVQFNDDYRQLLDRLQRDEGVGKGREDQLIWLLWHEKEEALHRVKEWETALRDMNVCHGSVREALRVHFSKLDTSGQSNLAITASNPLLFTMTDRDPRLIERALGDQESPPQTGLLFSRAQPRDRQTDIHTTLQDYRSQ